MINTIYFVNKGMEFVWLQNNINVNCQYNDNKMFLMNI